MVDRSLFREIQNIYIQNTIPQLSDLLINLDICLAYFRATLNRDGKMEVF